MTQMRIVLVISNLIHGGAETQVIAMSRELRRRGHAVAIYTLNSNNPRACELDGSGVELVADQKRMKLDPAVIWRLRRFLRAFGADIVHGFLYDGDLYSRVAAAATGIPALNSERNDNYRLKPQQQLGLWLTRHLTDGVVANSHAGARFAARLFRIPEARVHVVWNGVDLAAVDSRVRVCKQNYKTEFFADASIRLACLVGNIKPAKDYQLALLIADLLTRKNPAWKVLFVGDRLTEAESYSRQIMSAYRDLKLEGRVLFAGLRKDVPEIMSQCDVVFSTSQHEGFPNVVLEAMAVGTPVVSTEYSDIRRILPLPWQIVAERTPEVIASTILRAQEQREVLAPMQRAWVETHATVQLAGEDLERTYMEFLS